VWLRSWRFQTRRATRNFLQGWRDDRAASVRNDGQTRRQATKTTRPRSRSRSPFCMGWRTRARVYRRPRLTRQTTFAQLAQHRVSDDQINRAGYVIGYGVLVRVSHAHLIRWRCGTGTKFRSVGSGRRKKITRPAQWTDARLKGSG